MHFPRRSGLGAGSSSPCWSPHKGVGFSKIVSLDVKTALGVGLVLRLGGFGFGLGLGGLWLELGLGGGLG